MPAKAPIPENSRLASEGSCLVKSYQNGRRMTAGLPLRPTLSLLNQSILRILFGPEKIMHADFSNNLLSIGIYTSIIMEDGERLPRGADEVFGGTISD